MHMLHTFNYMKISSIQLKSRGNLIKHISSHAGKIQLIKQVKPHRKYVMSTSPAGDVVINEWCVKHGVSQSFDLFTDDT